MLMLSTTQLVAQAFKHRYILLSTPPLGLLTAGPEVLLTAHEAYHRQLLAQRDGLIRRIKYVPHPTYCLSCRHSGTSKQR